jgi:hypothetical protein
MRRRKRRELKRRKEKEKSFGSSEDGDWLPQIHTQRSNFGRRT